MSLLPRFAESLVLEALADTRVVIVNGARQVGKSTVVRSIARKESNVLYRTLDRSGELSAAKADPEAFVRHHGLLVIDEIQRVPQLILPIKAVVDEEMRPGQFLLTGSARIMGMKSLLDALVGRSETIELWPFSQSEIEGATKKVTHFAERLFDDDLAISQVGRESRDGYVERILRGGYPEATKRSPPRRAKFFESYVRDLIDRDVAQLSEIERRSDLMRLVRLMAERQATLVKLEEVASAIALPVTTLERYIRLLEQVFLIKRIPAWSSSKTPRASRMQKLLFVDSGIAAYLSGLNERRIAREPARLGPMLENFVISEIARQLGWSSIPTTIFHYRTRDGEEVDAVLEANDGRLVGIEVKAASTVLSEDFRHLRHLERRIGGRFHRGIVLYTGDRPIPFGRNLAAIPVDALWSR